MEFRISKRLYLWGGMEEEWNKNIKQIHSARMIVIGSGSTPITGASVKTCCWILTMG